MRTQLIRTLVLSIGFLGIASTASDAGRGPAPAVASTDPDADSASSDPQTEEPEAGSDQAPAAKDKRRDASDPRKPTPGHWSDLKARLRARKKQVDRALDKLLSVKARAMQLLHGTRPRPTHADPDETPDDDAPAADPQAPAPR